jgi:molybdopterin converting factor small subunit
MQPSESQRTIQIKVFAGLREGLARDLVIFSLPLTSRPEDLTTRVIKSSLVSTHPDLANLIQASRLAVNHTFVDDDASLELALAPGVDIALIPPVSGG